MKKHFILAALIFGASSTSTLWAQSSDALRNEINQLKQSLENSNQKLADAMNNILSLQQDINSLKGNNESGGFLVDQQNKAIKEYDQRILVLEEKVNTAFSLLSDIKESRGSEKTLAASEAETKEFQKTLDSIFSSDYAKATEGFQAFLQKYPKSNLGDAAQYWIAESSFALNDFKKAITDYQALIQKYPKSSKVKAAIYKQGLSFFNLKLYPESKAFFEKVIATYPNSNEASRAAVKVKELEKLLAQTPQSGPSPTNLNNTQNSNLSNSSSDLLAPAGPGKSNPSGGLYR